MGFHLHLKRPAYLEERLFARDKPQQYFLWLFSVLSVPLWFKNNKKPWRPWRILASWR